MYSGCHIWDWGGAFCILDGLNGIVDNEFDFGGHFTFGGGVFGDLDDIFGILYGDYAIWDDYLVFELIYFVFLFVHLVCWATYLIFGNTPVCILDAVFCFFDDFLVFWMVHFRGPTVRGPICHFFGADSWAPDNWAPGPNCPGPNCPP